MVEQTRAIGKAVAAGSEPAASPTAKSDSSAGVASPSSPKAPTDSALPLMVTAYQSSALKVANDTATDAAMVRAAADASTTTDQAHDTRPGFFWQLGALLHRETLNLWRSPSTQTTRLVVVLFVALFFGITCESAADEMEMHNMSGYGFSNPMRTSCCAACSLERRRGNHPEPGACQAGHPVQRPALRRHRRQ